MIRLIRFLITGDWHLCKWEEYGPGISASLPGVREPFELRQPCRCKTCGAIKSFKL